MLIRLISYGPAILWLVLTGLTVALGQKALRRSGLGLAGLADPEIAASLGSRLPSMEILAKGHHQEDLLRVSRQIVYCLAGLVALLPPLVYAGLQWLHFAPKVQFPVASTLGWSIAFLLLIGEVLDYWKALVIEHVARDFRAAVDASRDCQNAGASAD